MQINDEFYTEDGPIQRYYRPADRFPHSLFSQWKGRKIESLNTTRTDDLDQITRKGKNMQGLSLSPTFHKNLSPKNGKVCETYCFRDPGAKEKLAKKLKLQKALEKNPVAKAQEIILAPLAQNNVISALVPKPVVELQEKIVEEAKKFEEKVTEKTVEWVKEHPTETAIIVGVVAFVATGGASALASAIGIGSEGTTAGSLLAGAVGPALDEIKNQINNTPNKEPEKPKSTPTTTPSPSIQSPPEPPANTTPSPLNSGFTPPQHLSSPNPTTLTSQPSEFSSPTNRSWTETAQLTNTAFNNFNEPKNETPPFPSTPGITFSESTSQPISKQFQPLPPETHQPLPHESNQPDPTPVSPVPSQNPEKKGYFSGVIDKGMHLINGAYQAGVGLGNELINAGNKIAEIFTPKQPSIHLPNNSHQDPLALGNGIKAVGNKLSDISASIQPPVDLLNGSFQDPLALGKGITTVGNKLSDISASIQPPVGLLNGSYHDPLALGNGITTVGNKLSEISTSVQPFNFVDPDSPPRIYRTDPSPPLTFEIPGKKLSRGCIGGINGIGNYPLDANGTAKYVGKLSGDHHIDWVYNRTNTAALDVLETVLLNYQGVSAPAGLLKEKWVKFHEEHKDDPDAKYLQICHSQGALHVKIALQGVPKEIRDRIIVVAIAPATIVPKNLCSDSFNYAIKGDPIPYGEVAFYAGFEGAPVHTLVQWTEEAYKELILLEPQPGEPLHEFQSETFKKVIEKRLEEYIMQYGTPQ